MVQNEIAKARCVVPLNVSLRWARAKKEKSRQILEYFLKQKQTNKQNPTKWTKLSTCISLAVHFWMTLLDWLSTEAVTQIVSPGTKPTLLILASTLRTALSQQQQHIVCSSSCVATYVKQRKYERGLKRSLFCQISPFCTFWSKFSKIRPKSEI